MSNEANPSVPGGPGPSTGGPSARTGTASGATKVFREFKWGLLTLFLLMVVVIGLVYDGGRRKEAQKPAPKTEERAGAATDGGLVAQGQPPALPTGPAYTDDFALGNPGARVTDTFGQPGTRQVTPAPQPERKVAPPDLPTGVPPVAPRNRLDTAAGATETAASEYKVQSGDTLEGIARKLFPGRVQTGVKLLCEVNQISDPRRIQVNQMLKVPALPAEKKVEAAKPEGAKVTAAEPSADPAKSPKPAKTEAAAGEEHTYQVQPGDTLERIARRVLKDGNRWREIYELNRDQIPDPHVLQVGQKLKIKGESAAPEANQEAQPAKVIKNPKVAQNDEAGKGKEKNAKPATLEHSETVQRWMP